MSRSVDRIEHEGRIVEISEDSISVEIVNKSACAACHAKGVCAAGEEAVKIVEVPLSISTLTSDYKVGDTVNVVLSGSLGVKAIWFAYIIPLIVLLAAIFTFSAVGVQELYVGLLSLAVVAVYYIGLAFFRNKLSKIFTFSIESK